MATIAYLAHDTNDAAVERRVRMFQEGGDEVRLGGFHRRAPHPEVAGVAVHDLGETADARLLSRLGTVARHLIRPADARALVAGADVIVARNLEMLGVAARVAQPGQRLVYECLDIHRLLLSDSAPARAVQAIERRLLSRVDMVLTSAPAFRDAYFRERRGYTGPIWLEENRLLQIGGERSEPTAPAANKGSPLRIGWFGMLRCHRSLAILRALTQQCAGEIEVLIAGIPSYTEFDDFDRDVADTPGVRFVGRYAAGDLPRLYGDVDFAWAIDYFEEGQNSRWLLPNRLYESLSFGAVPIALSTVETGRWCTEHGVGVLVEDPAAELPRLLARLSQSALTQLRAAAATLPRSLVVADAAACRALTSAVVGGANE
jgi:succinoglycan biosynthesis protein ExoL